MEDDYLKERITFQIIGGNTSNDESISRALFNFVYDDCIRVAIRRTRCLHDAEDVVQEVLIKIFSMDYRQFLLDVNAGEGARVKNYFLKAVRNQCNTHYRQKKRQYKIKEFFDNSKDSTQMHSLDYLMLDLNFNRALEKLNPKQRKIFCLRMLDHLSHSEIADLGAAESKSDSKITTMRARKIIKNALLAYKFI